MRNCLLRLSLALAVMVATQSAHAQEWPNQPVRIITPFAAGGTADILCRTIADHFSAVFGKPFDLIALLEAIERLLAKR